MFLEKYKEKCASHNTLNLSYKRLLKYMMLQLSKEKQQPTLPDKLDQLNTRIGWDCGAV